MSDGARFGVLALTLLQLLSSACGFDRPRSRYKLAVDPGASPAERWVMDRESGAWVHLHCELRVSDERPLPEPLRHEDYGDMLSFTDLQPQSMGSAGIAPSEYKEREGHRVWLWRTLARPSTLEGRAGFSVQASWPTDDGPPRFEAMEVFNLPPLTELEPYQWSPWRPADEVRGGAFANWEELHGVGAESAPDGTPLPLESSPTPDFPYELRCRAVLSDRLHVPVEADDPNVGRPDPRDTGAAR